MEVAFKGKVSKKRWKPLYTILVLLLLTGLTVIWILYPKGDAKFSYKKTEITLNGNIMSIDSILKNIETIEVDALLQNNFKLYDSINTLKNEIASLKRNAQELLIKWVQTKDKPNSEKQSVLNEITEYLKSSSLQISKYNLDHIQTELKKPDFIVQEKVTPVYVDDNRLRTLVNKLLKDRDSLLELIQQRDKTSDSVLAEFKRISASLDSFGKIPRTSYAKPSIYVSSYDFKPIVGRLRKGAYRRKDVNEKGFNLSFTLGSNSLQKEFENDKITVVIKYMLRGSGTDGVTPKSQEFSVKLNQLYSINISKGNFGVGSYSFAIYHGDIHSKPLCLDVFTVR